MPALAAWLLAFSVAPVGQGAVRPRVPVAAGKAGLGMGLELPALGIVTGFGEKNGRFGWGSVLGVGASWDLGSHAMIHASYLATRTVNARANLRYQRSGGRLQDLQPAAWRGASFFLGGAYLWHVSSLHPFLGAALGLGYGGYLFRFDDAHREDLGSLEDTSGGTGQVQAALGIAWSLIARGGARLDLNDWLGVQLATCLSLVSLGVREVTHTKLPREVRVPRQRLLLVDTTFAVRLAF